MKHELEPIGRTIMLCGKTDGVGLIDRAKLTDEQLLQNDLTFQRCGKLLGWEWADNIAEMMDRKLREQARQLRIDFETDEDRAKRNRQNVREYAEVRGLAAQTVLVRVCVADMFPINARSAKLEFSHHIEVWAAGMVGSAAHEWLAKAEVGNGNGKRWSVAELRGELNKARFKSNDDDPAIEDDVPRDLSRFERWAAVNWTTLKTIKPLDAVRMLSDMPCAVRVVDHLRVVAGVQPPPLRVLPAFPERR